MLSVSASHQLKAVKEFTRPRQIYPSSSENMSTLLPHLFVNSAFLPKHAVESRLGSRRLPTLLLDTRLSPAFQIRRNTKRPYGTEHICFNSFGLCFIRDTYLVTGHAVILGVNTYLVTGRFSQLLTFVLHW